MKEEEEQKPLEGIEFEFCANGETLIACGYDRDGDNVAPCEEARIEAEAEELRQCGATVVPAKGVRATSEGWNRAEFVHRMFAFGTFATLDAAKESNAVEAIVRASWWT